MKQRRRTVAQRTPEAIRKAIDLSLISDIIETIATAGTKDEVPCPDGFNGIKGLWS